MRRRLRLWPVSLAIALFLAGCTGGGNDGGDGAGLGGDASTTSRSGDPSEEVTLERFAVLVVEGRLEGDGPAPGPVSACSPAPPSGSIDLVGQGLWARPGQHDFKPGDTWLVVLDRVEVDDPRGGCSVPKVTSFVFDGQWTPQIDTVDFRLQVYSDGDDLLIGKNPLEPGNEFPTRVEFEDDAYTFTGNLTFHHYDWWQMETFEERDVETPPDDAGAVWWVRQDT